MSGILPKTAFVTEPGQKTVTMTRLFNAPRTRVYDAMTKPDLLKKWYAPAGFEVTLCESNLQVGGAYRIVQRTPDGNEFGFRGIHRELVPPERRVYTWIFELMPDKEVTVTETFEDRDGNTFFTAVLLFPSVEDRDAYLGTGATEGGSASMDRLEELLRAAA